jgi:hypothetical protein
MNKWQEQFDKEFIYDTFDNTGLTLLGNRKENRPVRDDEIQNFISTEIIEKIIEDIPDEYGANEVGYGITKRSREFKQQLRERWLS